MAPSLGLAGLCGAFTDSNGAVIEPISFGATSKTLPVPFGATQLQLGVDDDIYHDNFGSFVVSVNGTNITVPPTAMPWNWVAGGLNSTYEFGVRDGTSPVVALTGLTQGQPVTVAYQSGTVSAGPGFPLVNGDGDGGLITGFGKGSSGSFFPTFYMSTLTYSVGTRATFTAVVTNTSGALLPNQAVTFIVSGANPQQIQVATDANGIATFSYIGSSAGTDAIQAQSTVSGTTLLSNSESVSWTNLSHQPAAISLSPATAGPVIPGRTQTMTAVVTDAQGVPVSNVTVTFNVSGTNHATGTGVTNTTGTATFSYVGNAGTDSVLAIVTTQGNTISSNPSTITWSNATNQPPVVSAGANQTITLPVIATLPGTATDDGLPNGTLTITWSKLSFSGTGAGIVSFSAPNQPGTQAAFSDPGTYVLQLSAFDGALTSTSNVTITVNPQSTPNQPPVVSAGSSQSTLVGATVVLAGTVTDDGLPLGAIVTSLWTKLSGPGNVTFGNAGLASTTASFDQPGIYELQLSATDTQYTSTSQMWVAVNNPPQPPTQPPVTTPVQIPVPVQNRAPVASIQYSQTVAVGSSATLDGSKTTDDGLPNNTLSYEWTLLNGPGTATFSAPTQATGTVTFSAAGTYVLQFAVSDSQLTTTLQFSITVVAQQQAQAAPPIVNAGQPQTIVLPTNSATLRGIAFSSNSSVTLNLQWSLISGPGTVIFSAPTSTSTIATFSTTGVYLLQLSANDGQHTTTATTTVTVAPQPPQGQTQQNQPPTIHVATPPTITLPSNTLTLSGTAADDGLPVGSTLSVVWVQTGGPAPATIAAPNQDATSVTFSQPGTYTFTFTASDTQLTSTATVTLFVLAQAGPAPTAHIDVLEGTTITQPTPISGSISGGNWTVAVAPNPGDGSQPSFQTIATGTGAVNGTLTTLDPTMMLNGNYVVQVSTQDQFGQTASASTQVDVERNLKIGNFTISFNDMSIPVPGLPITVTRTYGSRNHSVGDFGYGWTLSLSNIRVTKSRNFGQNWYEDANFSGISEQYCLSAASNRTVSLTFPDGRVYKFQVVSNPQCQTDVPIENPGLGFTQIPTDSSTAGAKLEFIDPINVYLDGAVPGPVNILDVNGNFFDTSRFKLTTADGYVYLVDQKLGATQVTDPNGNTLTINANGITHSDGQSVVFVRDGQSRITSIQDPNGKSIIYNYSAAGDLQNVTDRDQNTITFGYDTNHPHYLNEVDDPRGVPAVRNTYDDSGRLVSTTDATGHTITYDHRLAQNQEAVTDRLNFVTVYTYDADGNVTEKDDPAGGITYSTYDLFDNKIAESNNVVTKPTVYTYDSLGNRLTETDPLGHVTTYAYNARKQVTDVTDPNGNHTQNTYDPNTGNLLSTVVLNTNVPATTYTYYPGGLPNVVTDPTNAQTTFTYDSAGNLQTQTDALKNKTTYTYDSNGNKKSQAVTRTKSDGTKETLTTQYAYDNTGRLTKTTYPDSSFTQTVYNSIGKPSDTYDAKLNHTHYDYDDNGRLKTVTYPDNTTESYGYDAEGHKTKFTDRAGHATQYVYDQVGRLTQTIALIDNSFTQTTYDFAGRVTATQDADQNQTSYGYDDVGRRTSIKDALGNVTQFFYDANGNQTSVLDANLHTTYTDYDQFNRRVKVRYPDGTNERFAYDADGRLTDKYDQAGKHSNYVYDLLGRLTDVYQAPETLNLNTHYGYDELGERTSQRDANQHTTTYAYDQLGRRSSRTLPMGQTESYLYDNNGNLTSKKDFNGHTTTYSYDSMNRLLSKTADAFFGSGACTTASGLAQVSFTYTQTGKRQTMCDVSGATTYTYDNRDRLQSKQTPFGTLTYTYDNAGNLTSIVSSNGNGANVSYNYDKLSRLQTVTDNAAASAGAANAVTTYGYDPAGNLKSVAYPNTVTSTYNYDLLNRLTKLTATTPTTALANYQYTLGAAGNRTAVTELNGRSVQYGYDDIYRLTSETIAGATSHNGTIGYTYDAVGNRQQIMSTVEGIPTSGTLFYDANDRTATDNYDANGNTISSGGVANAYDFENHMVQHGAVTIVYDGDGNRVSEAAGSTTTNYLVDALNPTGYAQVVDELQSGLVTRSYTLGLERISQRQVASSQQLSFYGFDGHGSVRYLTDITGAVTDTYDYDAFGNLLISTGSTPNNYRFAGEQWDPNLGLYYNRARYMDVGSGRFLSVDTDEGLSDDPRSLHKYTYAHGDPVNFVDPSGNDEFTIAGQTFNISIASVVQSIAVSSFQGAVAGAIIGGTDAALGGDDVIQGALNGAATGAILGPFSKIRVAAALLGLFGFAIGGEKGVEAIEQGHVAQGIFRLGLSVFSAVAAVRSISAILRTPGTVTRGPIDQIRETDYPTPPEANDGNSTIGSNPGQNRALAWDIRLARFLGAEDIRVNQEQVNADGIRVGRNRPDLQFTLRIFARIRVYIEYDPETGGRAAAHQSRILANDPWSIIISKIF